MEAFTSGNVSWRAVKALKDMPGWKHLEERVEPVGRGVYRFYGWESELSFVRAMGRGHASGSNKPVHQADIAQQEIT